MAHKLSDLLDSQRLRALWPRLEGTAAGTSPGREPAGPLSSEVARVLGGPHIPREPAQLVLRELEEALRAHLGLSALLLVHLVHPLRAAVARLGLQAVPMHPLARASRGSVHALIDRLDDTLTSLIELEGR